MKILKFGAKWCAPCRVLEDKLKDFDVCEVVKYDLDDDDVEKYAEKFKIRNIPLMVLVDDNENELKRWVGLMRDFDAFKKEVESFK